MKWIALVGGCFGVVACSSTPKPFEVDLFHMRSTELAGHEAGMVRGDQLRVLYGKVETNERVRQLGQYYTFRRSQLNEEAVVKFFYQQVDTRSKVYQVDLPMEAGVATVEFANSGEDYLKRGRLLAWKAELWQGGEIVTSEQSYMWE